MSKLGTLSNVENLHANQPTSWMHVQYATLRRKLFQLFSGQTCLFQFRIKDIFFA